MACPEPVSRYFNRDTPSSAEKASSLILTDLGLGGRPSPRYRYAIESLSFVHTETGQRIVPIAGSTLFGTGYVFSKWRIRVGCRLIGNMYMERMLLVFSGVFTCLLDAYSLYAARALAAKRLRVELVRSGLSPVWGSK